MRLRLSGLNLGAENIKSLLIGGIAFATPSATGPAAADDERFSLSERADDKWLKWSPLIELTNASPAGSLDSPSSLLLNTVDPARNE
jgi:paraquat-inducible protein B